MAVSAVVCAIGIGINTAPFSSAYAICFRPAAGPCSSSIERYPDPEYCQDHPDGFTHGDSAGAVGKTVRRHSRQP
jgi:hypothetical protein